MINVMIMTQIFQTLNEITTKSNNSFYKIIVYKYLTLFSISMLMFSVRSLQRSEGDVFDSIKYKYCIHH